MLNDLAELRKFIQFCKDEKIQEFKVGEVHVVFSALALMPELSAQTQPQPHPEQDSDEEYQKTLFHSSNA